MPSVCFYFQVHQPFRIKKYQFYEIGKDHLYFNDSSETDLNNQKILRKVAHKCYIPTNQLLLELLQRYPEFKLSYSLSGVFLEQCEMYLPEVIHSFQKLVDTGQVELLNETYYHSLSFLYSKEEFEKQVILHQEILKRLFNVTPRIFRNTELIYNNDLACEIEKMGYKGILSEGADHVLDWRSPNFVYSPKGSQSIKLLLKNYKLSDDIAFRFSCKGWEEYPLTVPKFSQWIDAINGNGNVVNLFMDYETFGEHQWEDTGIFEFLRHLPEEILKHPDNNFMTPSEVIDHYEPVSELNVHHYISWADIERDLSAWLENPIQQDSMKKIYELEEEVLKTNDDELIHDWRKLQTSDHFYYMCTKWFADGDVHKYFNPYQSPYDAFISFINVLNDLKFRIHKSNNLKKVDCN